MPVDDNTVPQPAGPHRHPRLVRMVTGLAGRTRFRMRVEARPGYGLMGSPLVADGERLHGDSDGHHWCLSGTIPVRGTTHELTVNPRETLGLRVASSRPGTCIPPL